MSDTAQNGSPFGFMMADAPKQNSQPGLSTEKYCQVIGSWRERLKEELEKKDSEIAGSSSTDDILLGKLHEILRNQEGVRGAVLEETSKRLQFLSRFSHLEDALGVIREHTEDMQAISAEFMKVQKLRTDKRQVLTQRYKEALLFLEKLEVDQETSRNEAKDRLNVQLRKNAEFAVEVLRVNNQMTIHGRELSEKLLVARSWRSRLDELRSSLDLEQSTRDLIAKDTETMDVSEREKQFSLAAIKEAERDLTEKLDKCKVDSGELFAAANTCVAKSADISSAIRNHQEDHSTKKNVLENRQNENVLRVGDKTSRIGGLEAVKLKLQGEIAEYSETNESSRKFVVEVSESLARLRVEKDRAVAALAMVSAKRTSLLDGVDVQDHDRVQQVDQLKSQTQMLLAKQRDVESNLQSLASKNKEEQARTEGRQSLENLQNTVQRLRNANNEGLSPDEASTELQKQKKKNTELADGLKEAEAELATWSGSRKSNENALEEQKNEIQKLNDYLKSAKKKLAETKKFSERLAQSTDVDEMFLQRLAQQQELTTSVATRRSKCDEEVTKGVLMVKHKESTEITLDNLNKEVKVLQEERRKAEARAKMAAPIQSPVKRQLIVQGAASKSPAKRPVRVPQRTYQEDEEVSSQPSVTDSDDSAFSMHLPIRSTQPPRQPREARAPPPTARPMNSRRDVDNEPHRGYQTMDDF
ncbi:hypothetical protein RvY_05171 [Ramazzottius varieornatus]|uniref:Uncharacterized protein n=1 Tax=Ramazzottius varieornatus TaxID=947166 RepID=A0A1D1UXQ8_RAMVA|nr:hypothetical protein RvY_05171 [Ramazzottius varieornatus]